MMGKGGAGDVEAGPRHLYPTMLESPALRWAFIRKVYAILTFQLLLTIAVASVVVNVRPIADFFVSTTAGLALYICIIFIPLIVLCPLYYYHQRHPINFLLLVIFTLGISLSIGLTCAFTSGVAFLFNKYEKYLKFYSSKRGRHFKLSFAEASQLDGPSMPPVEEKLDYDITMLFAALIGMIILEAAILTAIVVISLTLYTFWAARRGQDFGFLGPFLFASLLVILVFTVIQMFFPMGKITTMIFGCLAALVFAGYIIYDTDNLIKRHTYDEYIWAAVSLYLDIINLFQMLLLVFDAADS